MSITPSSSQRTALPRSKGVTDASPRLHVLSLLGEGRKRAAHAPNASIPVMALPRTSVWTSWVPSYV
jgi:hypothetical protein